ncbi:outer membrane protein assembly factor BamE domain-containing protein [Methylomonas sp. CM2]|uniref:outer membrane protein assembly factor BamE domain-containing protein n=1 Tax=Methylomonas sp. CM2 TaxID=3417647 RepID=UPI003CE82D5F
MKSKLPVIFSAIIIATTLTACSKHSGNVKATDQNLVDQIKIGKTTKAEVKALFGETTNIMRMHGTETWNYNYSQTDIGAKAFVPFANLTGESAVGVKMTTLGIQFDDNGIVKNVTSNTGGNR